MRTGQFTLLVTTLIITLCRADFLQYADQIPTCGLSCLLQEIPVSACQTFTNSTCICTDPNLFTSVDACMASNCTNLDRLTVAKVDEQACDKPTRRRTDDIPGLLFIDALAVILITVRIIARYMTVGEMEIDDWVVVALFPCLLTFIVLGNYVRLNAIGYDVWDLEVPVITLSLKLFFIDELLYTACLALARVNLLLFLIRVFAIPPFRKICWVALGWVVLSAVVVIFMTLFQCIPISYNWEGWTGETVAPRCVDVNALAYAAASIGIAQDLVILLLPLPIIVGLNMPLKKRILTMFMFSLGILVVLTSCLRLKSLVQFAKSIDPTWDYTDAVIWTSLEVKVMVIVLCLPTVRMLFARVAPSIFGITQKSTPQKSSNTGVSGAARRNEFEYLSNGPISNTPPRISWESDVELWLDNDKMPWAHTGQDGDQANNTTDVSADRSKESWS